MLVALIGRLLSELENSGVVRFVIVPLIYKIGAFSCIQKHYDQNYGKPATLDKKKSLRSRSSSNFDPSDLDWPRMRLAPSIRRASPAQSGRSSYDHEKVNPVERLELEWQRLPVVPIWIKHWHTFTTIWFSYMIFRYIMIERIQAALQQSQLATMLRLKSTHCYLVGRFILDRNFANVMGVSLALMHISWRFSQLFARAKPLALVYFLLLSQHDLELIYKQFPNTSGSIQMTTSQFDELSWCERFVYDLMCYRVAYRTKTLLKLRPNRTRLAHRLLRRRITRWLVIGLFAFMLPVGIVIAPLIMYKILLDTRFIGDYPKCEPELEQLVRSKPLDADSFSWPTPRRLLIILVDFLENLTVWLDSGISCTSVPLLICLMGYDLTLAWRGIASKIVSLEWRLRRDGHSSDGPAGQAAAAAAAAAAAMPRPGTILRFPHRVGGFVGSIRVRMAALADDELNQSNALMMHKTRRADEIYQLISEIYDFFEQVRKLDLFMRQFVLSTALAFIGFCSVFTYFSQSHAIARPPFEVLAILAALMAGLSLCCFGFLMVNHYCLASYSRVCSLMAHDTWKSEHNFEVIVELYTKKKSCFTLLGQYPFQGTTFLSLFGWTFSCFCLIAGSLRRA